MGESARQRIALGVEKAWLLFVGTASLYFVLSMAMSYSVGGLGVTREAGEFVLLQGLVRRDVSQAFGLVYLVTTYVFFATFALSALLSIAVYVKRGSMVMSEILKDVAPDRRYWLFLLVFLFLAALSPAIAILTLEARIA